MDNEELGYDELEDKLNIQITVRAGESAGVDLAVIIPVKKFFIEPLQARSRIQSVIDNLLCSIPFETIKGLDAGSSKDIGMDAAGNVVMNPALARAQAELRRKIEEKEKNKQEPPPHGHV